MTEMGRQISEAVGELDNWQRGQCERVVEGWPKYSENVRLMMQQQQWEQQIRNRQFSSRF